MNNQNPNNIPNQNGNNRQIAPIKITNPIAAIT